MIENETLKVKIRELERYFLQSCLVDDIVIFYMCSA